MNERSLVNLMLGFISGVMCWTAYTLHLYRVDGASAFTSPNVEAEIAVSALLGLSMLVIGILVSRPDEERGVHE